MEGTWNLNELLDATLTNEAWTCMDYLNCKLFFMASSEAAAAMVEIQATSATKASKMET